MTEILAAIATLLTILLAIIKLWPKIKNILGITQLEEKIDLIILQLSPNGGSSLKDSIDRIERRQIFSLARQKSLMQSDKRPIFEADLEGNLVWANQAFLSLLGVDQLHTVLGRGWVTFLSTNMQEWDSAFSDNREFRGIFLVKDEEYSVETHTLRNEGGEALGYIGYVL